MRCTSIKEKVNKPKDFQNGNSDDISIPWASCNGWPSCWYSWVCGGHLLRNTRANVNAKKKGRKAIIRKNRTVGKG